MPVRTYRLISAILMLAVASIPALARDRAPAETSPQAAPAPVPNEPQVTTASFGDWTVRCVVSGTPPVRSCEVNQSLVVQEQGRQVPVAQVAFGYSAAGGRSLSATVLLPVNVSFDKPAKIGPDDAHLLPLVYRRCIPAGCFASAPIDADALRGLRTAAKGARIVFADSGERLLTLVFSVRGLTQALDDLAKKH